MRDRTPKNNFVKINLSRYVPALVEFIGELDFPWDKIDRYFSEEVKRKEIAWNDHRQKLLAAGVHPEEAENSNIKIEACIYHLIVATLKGNANAIVFLDFLERLFEELTDNLSQNEKILLRTSVKKMLMQFDLKYQDFLGEIAVLNYHIKLKTYRLTGIEKTIENSKPIDFQLMHTKTDEPVWIEVYNVHLESEKVVDEPAAIEKFLRERFIKKLEAKGVPKIPGLRYHLCPVIWADSKSLRVYNEYFKTNKFQLSNVLEPMAYLSYTYPSGYKHYFKPIGTLFLE